MTPQGDIVVRVWFGFNGTPESTSACPASIETAALRNGSTAARHRHIGTYEALSEECLAER